MNELASLLANQSLVVRSLAGATAEAFLSFCSFFNSFRLHFQFNSFFILFWAPYYFDFHVLAQHPFYVCVYLYLDHLLDNIYLRSLLIWKKREKKRRDGRRFYLDLSNHFWLDFFCCSCCFCYFYHFTTLDFRLFFFFGGFDF